MSELRPPAAQSAADPIQELARIIYTRLCGSIYAVADSKKPDPKAVAQLSFKLAETFVAANLQFNPVARAAHEARQKAGVKVADVDIDFAGIGAKS